MERERDRRQNIGEKRNNLIRIDNREMERWRRIEIDRDRERRQDRRER